MQYATDYRLLNQRLFGGKSEVSSALAPKSSPIYPGVEGPPFDPAKARELVAQVKAEGKWNGSFELISGNTPAAAEFLVLFKGMWEAVGIDVRTRQVSNLTEVTILKPKFEVATNGMAILDPAPWSTMNSWESGSPRARAGFSHPDMDKALKQLRAAGSLEETKRAMAEVQKVWNAQIPAIVWNHAPWALAVKPQVKGMRYGPDATAIFTEAWVKK
jgi:peptide/nickel transport system substrate-binding protein